MKIDTTIDEQANSEPTYTRYYSEEEHAWLEDVGKVRVLWSDKVGGHIKDVQLLFGKCNGAFVDREISETGADGRSYLWWLTQQDFLRKDVVDFMAEIVEREAIIREEFDRDDDFL